MRREYLGDALDFWKGALLAILRASSEGTRVVKVLPMFSDDGWSPDACDTYARLLGGTRADLLAEDQLTRRGREAYFARFERIADDVFVDPDKGVTINARREPAHARSQEVEELLSADNIVAVYQHRGRRGDPWLQHYRGMVSRSGTETIGYEGTQVGMLFVTHARERADSLKRALSRHLGDAAAGRILS